MITLKDYQIRVLDSLRDFFKQCSQDHRPEAAFQAVQAKNALRPDHYIGQAAEGLSPEMPYICLRVPTGGGKTLLASHAVGLAMKHLLHSDKSVVLWLVPSNTILTQTADALRDPRHPYRRALELGCGTVEVLTIEEALNVSRATIEGQTVVIVSTIQCFRVQDTTGRKVYAQNGTFAEHLQNLHPDRIGDLLPGPDGKPVPSLVNMLRLRRPICIIDEAHSSRTDLSFETLGQVLPSCIVEFTATPARTVHPSNVLHRVSAAELKAEDMIKLPLRVISRHPSQREQLLAEAISLRSDLEKLALTEGQETGEYLRPILLIQAERIADCKPLRERLVREDAFGLKEHEIKISTSQFDDLKDVKDIGDAKCPVRVIITVEKLREGWDCPFAYVLCSLKETRSARAIEQIVGRILRLPQATAKQKPDLNRAYAFSVSESIGEVLKELREALESNGFTAAEAEKIILPAAGTLLLGVHPETVKVAPDDIDLGEAQRQIEALSGKARIDTDKGEIMIYVPLSGEELRKLTSCVKSPESKFKITEATETIRKADIAFGGTGETRPPSPYQQNLDFSVPILCVRENGQLLEFESTFLLEHPWKLGERDASLSSSYDPGKRPKGKAGVIDVGARGEVTQDVLPDAPSSDFVTTLHQQVFALGDDGDWTVERLAAWLDRQIEHQDIPIGEMAGFLTKVVRGLMTKFGIDDIQVLALDRFRLREEVERRIQQLRDKERKTAFQQFLTPTSALAVSDDRTLNFRSVEYAPGWYYEGGFQFKKHYFGKVGELLEKTPNGRLTEEFQCAQFIDDLDEVEYWVRNLTRKPGSFRLQTSDDWFYPDFVCRLKDGRVLVIEYKGGHLYSGAEEKRAVGEIWASRSGGKCLFVMPTAKDFSVIENAAKTREAQTR